MVVEKKMVAMIDSTKVERENMVVTYGVVHKKEDMMASEHNRNDMNGLALSILVTKIEKNVHDGNGSHDANVEYYYYYYYYYKNMEMHYSHKNVVEEPYLHLPKANSFVLPCHVKTQVRNALLQVQLLFLVWRGNP